MANPIPVSYSTMKSLTASQIQAIDAQHIWHPYASLIDSAPSYCVASANGVRLKLADGQELIDGMASWWCAIHGYNHPVLNSAVNTQLGKMAHVMFGGLTHEPAALLAQWLVELTPEPLDKVFFSDSGSVSVEVAIKMALQYWQSQGHPEKSKLLALQNGYHGDTFAAMSVCDPDTGMHHLFKGTLAQQVFSEAPRCLFGVPFDPATLTDLEEKISTHSSELAAVILEPIVQGAGGMRFYAPEYLAAARELCDRYDVLLIADEIATGFGRTGKLFGCEWADISPDILCLGKALTGGYMTLAATLCSEKISAGICQGEAGVFMHGPTFMANPLACSVANASIDLLLESPWQARVASIEQQLLTGLAPCADMNSVADVRVLGAIGVVEMNQAVDVPSIQKELVEEGVWLRPFGKLIYVMPPYIMEAEDLTHLTDAMTKVIGELAV
jgi:adenosylmethionine---8-amino-7-oxononanoate aminotransferase